MAIFLIGFAYAGMLITQVIFSFFTGLIPNDNQIFHTTVLLSLTYCAMLLGISAVILLTRKNEFLSKFGKAQDYIYGIAYAATLICVGSIISSIIALFYNATDNINQSTAVDIAKNYPIIAVILFVIIGPITEELTYRVGLYSFLRRINKYAAMAITAVIFAFIHFNFDMENMANELWALPDYIISGLILTIAYEHRGPACSITAHMLINLFAVIFMFIEK